MESKKAKKKLNLNKKKVSNLLKINGGLSWSDYCRSVMMTSCCPPPPPKPSPSGVGNCHSIAECLGSQACQSHENSCPCPL